MFVPAARVVVLTIDPAAMFLQITSTGTIVNFLHNIVLREGQL